MKKRVLIVVAHCDDEAFLFGGRMLMQENSYDVLLVTNSEDSKEYGQLVDKKLITERAEKLKKSSELFGFRILESFGMRDVYADRLDINVLVKKLKAIKDNYDEVWTHSLLGGYGGHWHHTSIALATKIVFKDRVRFHGYGFNRSAFSLLNDIYKKKIEYIFNIYEDEFNDHFYNFELFINENLVNITLDESLRLYSGLMNMPDIHSLWGKNRWLYDKTKYELNRFEKSFNLIKDTKFSSILEVGSNIGVFTKNLLKIADPKNIYCVDIPKFREDIEKLGVNFFDSTHFYQIGKEMDLGIFMSVLHYIEKDIIDLYFSIFNFKYILFSGDSNGLETFIRRGFKVVKKDYIDFEVEFSGDTPVISYPANLVLLERV